MIQLFPYMTVVDDQQYYPASGWAQSVLRTHAEDPLVAALSESVREFYDVDLAEEVVARARVADPILSRHIQMFLAIALGRIAERRLAPPTGYAGYCAGIMPALILAGGIDVRGLMKLVPALNDYMRDMVHSFLRRGIYAAMLDFSATGWTDARIEATVRDGEAAGAYIKDRRSPTSWEVIGEQPPLLAWLDETAKLAGGMLRVGAPRRDTIAHTALADPSHFVASLQDVDVYPVSTPVASSTGAMVTKEDAPTHVRDVIGRTMFDPIHSAWYLETILASDDDIIFIGSNAALQFMLEGTGVNIGRFRIFGPETTFNDNSRIN